MALKLGEIPGDIKELPAEFLGDDNPVWGEKFEERAAAAARTMKRRKESQMVELGAICSNYQFSTERKRILDAAYEPSFEDNVKQDMSIDVYNREADELANA